MRKTLAGLVAIAGVILWASVMAQQNAPTAPVPPGLPDWAYTPPVPGAQPAPSPLPADDNAVVRIPGTEKYAVTTNAKTAMSKVCFIECPACRRTAPCRPRW